MERGADVFERATATDFFGVEADTDFFFFDGCTGDAVRGHGAGAEWDEGVAEEAGRGKSVSEKSLRMPSCGRSCL